MTRFWLVPIGRHVAVGAATLALAYAAGAQALSQAALMTAPAVALRFAPIAGRAEAIVADQLAIAQGAKTNLRVIEDLALRSLVREPLNPVALRMLGLVADARGQQDRARRFFALSEATSRRDLGAQLALIKYATDGGDLPAALNHYDKMMRTSVPGQTILFPILARGLADKEIRDELTRRLAPPPPWFWAFLNHAIADGQPQGDLASLVTAAMPALPDDADYRAFHARMLDALVASGQIDQAARYYRSLPGAQRSVLTEAGFTPATTIQRFAPITWEARTSAYIGATVDPTGRSYRVSANPGERAVVLRRILFLKPGTYNVAIDVQQISGASGHTLNWALSCGPAVIWSATSNRSQRRQEAFSVPGSCSSQSIALTLAGGTDQSIVDYAINNVQIRPGISPREP